jgi:hypothetical protein
MSRQKIVKELNEKSQIKLRVFNQTLEVFHVLKETLHEMSNDINEEWGDNDDRRLRLEYRDRGKFEAELKFADDVLIFSMHSDTFQFDRDHAAWKLPYVEQDKMNAYCGMISVYNFLSDSLKYNRADDLGYMVARLFVNHEKAFFVEGKRQRHGKLSGFGESFLDKKDLITFVETAMLYTLSFDLLVPPFDLVKEASVAQMNAKIESAKLQTGKRLGFRYNSDDVLEG